MNLLHMKYAVEIAKTNSLNKAAETLYVGQSALSRAIKELESSLGVTLFERSSKGMTLTPDGQLFIHYAKSVLKQVDNIENMFSQGKTDKQRFPYRFPGQVMWPMPSQGLQPFLKSSGTPKYIIPKQIL